MGQKLAVIRFGPGNDSRLTDPGYNPTFRLVVKQGEVESQVTSYEPTLTGYSMPSLPLVVDLGKLKTLTSAIIKSCIKNQKYLAIIVNDAVTEWKLYMKEEVLLPDEGSIASGSIAG